eukprot:jgi/Orpsp1_1/1187807/evm.model.d7180000060305.1
MSNMSFDTNSPPQSSLFEKTKIKEINEVSSSLSSIIKQSSQLASQKDNGKKQPIIIKNEEFKQLNEKEHQKNIPISFQQTVNNKPPLYINKNVIGDKKGVFLLKNKGLKLNSSFIDSNISTSIIQSKYPQTMTSDSLPIMNDVDNIKQTYLNIPTNLYENKQPLFPETNNQTKHHHHHHHHHHHRSKKTKEKRWGGGGGRSITLSLDGSEFIHKHNDNIIDPKEFENNTKSQNIDIVVTEEKEDYSKVHPLSLIMENLTCYPSYNSYNSHNEKPSNKNTNPDLLSLKKDDAVAVQHFFPDGWAF